MKWSTADLPEAVITLKMPLLKNGIFQVGVKTNILE
jgi:hypothetical protein